MTQSRLPTDGGGAFCPDGYVTVQEAVETSARFWFPEQIAAIENAAAIELAASEDKFHSMSSLEQVAHVLSGQPSISEGLRQRITGVQTETEHRLRNFLHQGVLTAYYFGGLFHQGRNCVACEFWATTEADGVLFSGSYFPFGKPRTRHEQRPSHPLFFFRSELAALLNDDAKSPLQKSDVPNAGCGDEENSHDITIAAIPDAKNLARNRSRAEEVSKPNRHKSRPSFDRAKRVIDELYPNGVPDQATVSNKKLCQRVSEKLPEAVSTETILRAAGRRK
jgi:hypothetical protein